MTKKTYVSLEAYRLAHGLSQEAAARKFSVSQSAWSNWERGRRRPAHRYLRRLVRDTGVSVAAIMGISL